MDEKQETVADIVAEMRSFKRYATSDSNDCRYVAYWLYQTFADRIEAAQKREVGNGAKMREALVNISKYADCAAMRQHDATTQHYIEQIRKWAEAALAEPPRNCDVGTAEKQVERFKEYCQSNMQYYCDMFGTHEGAGGWDCKEDCPIGKMVDKNDYLGDHCQLLWAQMPYEKGETK